MPASMLAAALGKPCPYATPISGFEAQSSDLRSPKPSANTRDFVV